MVLFYVYIWKCVFVGVIFYVCNCAFVGVVLFVYTKMCICWCYFMCTYGTVHLLVSFYVYIRKCEFDGVILCVYMEMCICWSHFMCIYGNVHLLVLFYVYIWNVRLLVSFYVYIWKWVFVGVILCVYMEMCICWLHFLCIYGNVHLLVSWMNKFNSIKNRK